jgi:hypothetical protein
MDTENMVHLYNVILVSYLKINKGHHEFCRKWNLTRKYHPEWSIPDAKGHEWYVLTDK